MTSSVIKIDPKLDLVLEREIDVPVELVWKAWTTPEHLRHWFAPKPWSITACELDLRPGGSINFTMRSPEGEEFPNTQCYLEVSHSSGSSSPIHYSAAIVRRPILFSL